MAEEIKKLVEEYRDGKISRREFIQKAVLLTGSLAAATTLFDSLLSPSAHSAQVDANDPDLVSEEVQYAGKAGTVFGYLTRPKASGKYPAIVVIHQNRGVNEHIRDVARRFAKQGYVALTPDYLSRLGGTKKVNPEGKDVNIRDMAPQQVVMEDTDAGFVYLRGRPEVRSDRLGIVGFCWGGGMAFAFATQGRGLKAVVVYYGSTPSGDLVKNIEAPLLAHYGELDKGITGNVPQTEQAMKQYNKSFTYKIYPGAGHAFNNNTDPSRYNAAAAKEAWGKTVEFFKKNLQS